MNTLADFQRYQQQFSARIRDPQSAAPEAISLSRMAVYEELIFNNLFASASACFPVVRAIVGESAWHTVMQGFLRQHSATKPLFRQIPEEFVAYLQQHNPPALQPWPFLLQLCHYEWVELAVAHDPVMTDWRAIDPAGDLLAGQTVLNPALRVLQYDYAVHRIAPGQVVEPAATQLLVYRNADDEVKFMELNAVTYQLITLLQTNPDMSGREALLQTAHTLSHPQPESVVAFGHEVLQTLLHESVILGTRMHTD